MAGITDRILIIICCMAAVWEQGAGKVSIICLLFTICFTCAFLYFDNRAVKTALIVVYAVMCMVMPQLLIMSPAVLYEVFAGKHYAVLILYLIQYVAGGMENLSIYLNAAIAFILAEKTASYEKKAEGFIRLQDEYSELKQRMEAGQLKLIAAQDNKIHMATLAERNRIAREIHDNVGHMLSRSILQVGALCAVNRQEILSGQLSALKETLDTAMNSIRESVHDLKDDAFDLEEAIRKAAAEYKGIDITLDYDMEGHTKRSLKYCFMAIIGEALTNTAKHSNADRVQIVLREHPALYQLLIEDNGTVEHNHDSEGMGLESMRERVDAFGGTINITRDNGFKIFIAITKNGEK